MGYCHPTDKIMITKTNHYSNNNQSFIVDRKPDKPMKQSHDYESVRNRVMEASAPIVDVKKNMTPKAKFK